MHGSDYAGLSEVVCKCLLWRVKLVSRHQERGIGGMVDKFAWPHQAVSAAGEGLGGDGVPSHHLPLRDAVRDRVGPGKRSVNRMASWPLLMCIRPAVAGAAGI